MTRSRCSAGLDIAVEFPEDQTCCGQPALNTGYWDEARPCAEHFVRVFKNAELVVCPSGSCTTMVRVFYPELLATSSLRADAIALASRTFELSEFLVKVAAVTQVGASFPALGYLSRFLPRAARASAARRTSATFAPSGWAETRGNGSLRGMLRFRWNLCRQVSPIFPAPWEIPRLTVWLRPAPSSSPRSIPVV